ncbi:MAG TPA: peptide MFS transporter [Kofleriaceae bacterium]|nr:peptide MFS transporter [Kofleriaceae bacterium]
MSDRPLAPEIHDRGFFGHPRGLSTLFFTEMWERFSWYGMRAFLFLYLIAPTDAGGMGMDKITAGVLFGIYTSLVYLMSLPGGWIADRFLGQRKSVMYGGIGIMMGHICLAIPTTNAFYLGLYFIILGTGLLKPNVSAMVGQLYSQEDKRRSAGFAIFYMGINVGALIAPIVAGGLAQSDWWKGVLEGWGMDPNLSWHFGFGTAAVCMFLGLVQYVIGWHKLGDVGMKPTVPSDPKIAARDVTTLKAVVAGCVLGPLLGALIVSRGWVEINYMGDGLSISLMCAAIAMFYVMHNKMARDEDEQKRIIAMVVLFVGCLAFFALFEQAATTMDAFADEHTDNSYFGWGFPSSWWQFVNPVWILILSPFFSLAWLRLSAKDKEPSSPLKFALGMVACGVSFAILLPALGPIDHGGKVSANYLMAFYFFQTVAELFISPVGLSSMSKLAPQRMTGMVMGVWFFAISIGEYLAGRASTVSVKLGQTGFFSFMTIGSLVIAAGLFLSVGPVRRMLGRSE